MNAFLIILQQLVVLLRYKIFILGSTFVASVIAIFLVLYAPLTYRAVGVVNPPSSGENSLAMLAAKGGGDLGNLLGDFVSTGANVTDCITILNSYKFSFDVIKRFNLEERYGFINDKNRGKEKKYHMADVAKAFRRNMGHDLTDEDAIVIIMEDTSAVFAKNIVDYMIHLLDTSYLSIQKSSIRENLGYLDQLVKKEEEKLAAIEDSLIRFQKAHNIYLPKIQFEASLKEIGELEAQIALISEKAAILKQLKGSESSPYKKLIQEKRALKSILNKKFSEPKESNSLTPALNIIPSVGTEFFRLERKYKIRLAVFKFLIKQVEALKVEFGKNIKQITIVDPPWVNTKKVAPPRRSIVQMIFILTLLITSILSIIHYKFKKHKSTNSEHYKALQDIKGKLFTFK